MESCPQNQGSTVTPNTKEDIVWEEVQERASELSDQVLPL